MQEIQHLARVRSLSRHVAIGSGSPRGCSQKCRPKTRAFDLRNFISDLKTPCSYNTAEFPRLPGAHANAQIYVKCPFSLAELPMISASGQPGTGC